MLKYFIPLLLLLVGCSKQNISSNGSLSVQDNPVEALEAWLSNDSQVNRFDQGYPMVLATCSSGDLPSARVMFARDVAGNSIRFYGDNRAVWNDDLKENSDVCALFTLDGYMRQVRLMGSVRSINVSEKINSKSELYDERRGRMVDRAGYMMNISSIEFFGYDANGLKMRKLFTRTGSSWREQTLYP